MIITGCFLLPVYGFLLLHLVVKYTLQSSEARLNRTKDSKVVHHSAQVSAADDREGRGTHSHSKDFLDLRPSCFNHGVELFVYAVLHLQLFLSSALRYRRCIRLRGLGATQVIVGFLRHRMFGAPLKNFISIFRTDRFHGLFFSLRYLREDILRYGVNGWSVKLDTRRGSTDILINSEYFSIPQDSVRVLTLNGIHLKLLSHVEGVVDGDTLGLFFLHVDYEVLAVDGVGHRVFDKDLMAPNRSVASVNEYIFIVFLFIFLLLTRVRGIVEEAEIRGVILVEGFADSKSPVNVNCRFEVVTHILSSLAGLNVVDQLIVLTILHQVLLLLHIVYQ